MPRSSRRGAVFVAGDVPRAGDCLTAAWSDAHTLASGDNEEMDMRRLAVSGLLGLLAVAELAARLSAGSTVRAGLAAGPVTHTGVSASTALLMCSLCLLATVPAALLAPVPAAMAVGAGAVLSLILFELVTVAGAAALVLVAYRLRARRVEGARGRAGGAVPRARTGRGRFWRAGRALRRPAWQARAARHGYLRWLLASAIPVAALAAMARRAREESRSHSAVRELTEGVLAEHLARGERAIIARELHDVVAHHISMIAVQAETARLTTPGLTDAGGKRLRGHRRHRARRADRDAAAPRRAARGRAGRRRRSRASMTAT